MRLSPREKQIFFQQLAQLLRSGQGLPGAAQRLAKRRGGRISRAARSLEKALAGGATAGEALANLTPALDPMERAVLGSMTRAGQLETALARLGLYFEQAVRARGAILRGCAYPFFIVNLSILCLNLPLIFKEGGTQAFVGTVGLQLGILYGGLLVCMVLWPILMDLGAISATVDRLLRTVPLLGKVRRAFATARFCGTYDLQLDAGVNVITGLQSAAAASRSGLLHQAAKRALPAVRKGEPVGPALADVSGALPAEVMESFLLAEETGQMYQVLPQLTTEAEEEAFTRLKTASEWIPRLIYLIAVLFAGWKIISSYQDLMKEVTRQIDSIGGV